MRLASATVFFILSVPIFAHAEARAVAIRRDAVVYAGEEGQASLGRVRTGQVYVQVQARARAAIAWRGAQLAWIDAGDLQPSSAPLLRVATQTGSLRVRAQPALGAAELGALSPGSLVASAGEQGNFRKIAWAGQDGWIERSFQRPADPTQQPQPQPQQPQPQPQQQQQQPQSGQPQSGQPQSGQPQSGQPQSADPGSAQPSDDSGSRNAPTNANASELEVMARIIKGEARHCPYEGMVAVGAVILNRVKHKNWPNSIKAVCHQPKQFSCYNPDKRATHYDGPIPADCMRAAKEALAGNDPTRGCQYFFNPYLVRPSWARRLVFVRRIGTKRSDTHDFYRLP